VTEPVAEPAPELGAAESPITDLATPFEPSVPTESTALAEPQDQIDLD
jgi:hypothetical protein